MSATIEPARDRISPPCGFTLVEVLVIVAILSLMAGVVFPSVERALQRQSFVESARRVELALHAARADAIAGGTPVRFLVSKDRHRFSYGGQRDRVPDTMTIAIPDGGITFFADSSAAGGVIDIADGKLIRQIVVRDAPARIERTR